MTRPIVEWSLRFRFIVLGLAAGLVLLGGMQLASVPVDAMPEFSPPYVEIQTEALGLSAVEVEQLITVPMEADLLQGVAFLDEIHSESVPGLSSIVLIFDPGTDIQRARQVVTERMTQAVALPNVSKPPVMLQPLSSASRVLLIGLSSSDMSLMDMSVLARWTIRPRLQGIPGVANVSIFGQRERQLQVQVDPERLAASGVSLGQVIEATGNALWVSPLSFLDASTPGTGGFIDTPNQRLGVRHVLPIRTADDLAQVAIEQEEPGPVAIAVNAPDVVSGADEANSTSILTLGDVANVVEDHQPLIGEAIVDDGAGLLLVIERFPGANTVAVTEGVERALEDLRPGLAGIEIDTSLFRPATFIDAAVGNLGAAILAAIVLAAAVILALGLGWRAAVVALISIPLSLLAGGLVLYFTSTSVNLVSLAGLVLAVAIVVDEVVVGMDALLRRARESRDADDDTPIPALIVAATLQHRGALAYATAIILLTLLPAFFVVGPAAAFAPAFSIAFAVAVIAAAAVALTVTPVLCSFLFTGAASAVREPFAARVIAPSYAALLSRTLTLRRAMPVLAIVAAGSLLVVVMSGVAFSRQAESPLMPTFRDRDLLIHWDGAPGTSRTEMERIVSSATRELRSIAGVANVGAHVGRAMTSDQVTGIEAGEIWVNVDPAADYDTTVAAIAEVVDGYPGLDRSVLTYQSERVDDVLSGPATDVVVRVYGQDLDVLRAKAAEVQEAVAGIDGVARADVESAILEPSIEIQVDLAAAASHGLRAGDVRRAAAVLLSGMEVGSLFEEQKVFEVVVWGTPEIRRDLTAIGALGIETPSGQVIRLDDVADVRVAPAPNSIERESVFRYVDVGVEVADRDAGAVVADIDSRIKDIAFPLEYHAAVLAETVEREAAFTRAWIVLAAVIVAILLFLQAAFGSWRLAALVLLALPSSLVGGMIGALAIGGNVSLGMLMGFIAVLAIGTRQAMTLATRMQALQREDGEPMGMDLIRRAAQERFAPILTTAVAVAAVYLPFLVLGDVAGLEVVRPMSAVIVGGLVTSTLMSLFAVPAICLLAGSVPERDEAAELVAQPGLSGA